MSTEDIEFEHPRVWQFSGRSRDKILTNGHRTYGAYNVYGYVALSLDKALGALRVKHPGFRVEKVNCSDLPIHAVVDDPEVVRVARRLEGKE